ncbi:DUF3973 domain-containing protein [Paenibacillus phytorum]|uniref:DUF3973 domain-containing protein n=1 Tax=Paenibacillus phytorum TaxID=2654977 RepID=UPI00149164CE
MNSYYCIECNLVHVRSFLPKESIFKSGFHYVNSTLYHVGLCRKTQTNLLWMGDTSTNVCLHAGRAL